MRQPTLLLVDDDPMVTQMVSMLLELNVEARVLVTNSAVEAQELLGREEIALLLTDYLMPDLNGISLIKNMRKASIRIPVILLTGYCDEPELMAHAESLAPLEVMVKPWNNEQLLQRVNSHLDKARAELSGSSSAAV